MAYICNHSFLDNPTFRGMRWHLLQSFDTIYILDLHGNSKKKETAPDGSKDENVFDIQQGVSINIFVKTGKKKAGEPARVLHHSLWGSRESKYDFLWKNDLRSVPYVDLSPEKPFLFFLPMENKGKEEYEKGFQINELFTQTTVGFVTAKDDINISFTKLDSLSKIMYLIENDEQTIRRHFSLKLKDARDWTVPTCKKDAETNFNSDKIIPCSYRPFDTRFTYYTGNSRGLYASPQRKVLQHFLKGDNVGLICNKQIRTSHIAHYLLSKDISGYNLLETANANPYVFPLYLYPTPTAANLFAPQHRVPNLDAKIVTQIAAGLGLRFAAEQPAGLPHLQGVVNLENPESYVAPADAFTPLDLLDYIYAVLHSPTYRSRYKEFLKIDFPRVPYPTDAAEFWRLVRLGGELRHYHLLEHPHNEQFITSYPADGDNRVEKGYPKYLGDKVFINETQHFAGVPEPVWNFYIGGYQPAQKWLKDRRERVLNWDDLLHYQRIIVALAATERVMGEIG